MRNEKIIEEIVELCFYFGIFEKSDDKKQIKKDIEGLELLKDVAFIERLYNIIFIKAKEHNALQNDRVKNLLIELEKIRLELE